MKNLQLHETTTVAFTPSSTNVTHITSLNGLIYLIQNSQLHVLTENTLKSLPNDNEPYLLNTTLDSLQFENKIWFGCRDRFIYYSPESNTYSEIPTETFACASWNATQEVLAVVYSTDEVATYSIDFENAIPIRLHSCRLTDAVPQTVYVGWGSENTQFRGSEGKRKPGASKTKATVPPVNDTVPRISWRGNGEMFAVNYWRDGERTFKVFEYPCSPVYECERVAGLQSPIAWRPQGNMIACVVVRDGASSVVVFEKNGYKRFEFSVAYADGVIEELKWSPNGEILSVRQKSSLSLYTTSNYKWYLKQTIVCDGLISYDWLPTTNALFSLQIATSRNATTHTFKSVVHARTTHDSSVVAVIDGPKLHLTAFERACVPPPMSLFSITAENPVNFLSLHPKKQFFAVVDSKFACTVFEYNDHEAKRRHTFAIGDGERPFVDCRFYWNDDRLEFVRLGDCEFYELLVVEFEGNEAGVSYKRDEPVGLRDVGRDTNVLETVTVERDGRSYVFGRTARNALEINGATVANAVTSFGTHDDAYLLFTTAHNRLACVRILPERLDELARSAKLDGFYSRHIEPGATIVCAVPKSANVVLQMPRGNLEVVSCRVIAIEILEKMLERCDWREALRYVRTERLNANLFVDLNASRFLENVGRFVEACETASVLNGVCLEIDDANVLTDVYAKCWFKPVVTLQNKRTVVCAAILAHLQSVDYANYIASVVVINVRHFGVEDALVCVQDLLERQQRAVASEAVRTLHAYAKSEDLYEKSLALYDLNLARFVASFTQMDPKAYEPFLDEIADLSECQRRFRINTYLKKHELALKYLVRDRETDASVVLEHVRTHNIPEIAYGSVERSSDLFVEVSRLLGAKLSMKAAHEEAAVVYERARLWPEATREFRACRDWEKAVECLRKFENDDVRMREVMANVAEELVRAKMVKEASRVYLECLGDRERALAVLVDGGLFREAFLLQVDEPYVLKKLKNHCLALTSGLFDAEKTFVNHKNRLQTVRKSRLANYKNLNDPDAIIGHDENSDLYSDAGSQTTSNRSTRTSNSRLSTQSSRNRRKEERKKQDLRVGGVYEDIALVRVLHAIASQVFDSSAEVRELSLVLLEHDLVAQAKFLQGAFVESVRVVRESLADVWPPSFSVDCKCETDEEAAVNENVGALDEAYRKPPKDCGDGWRLVVLSC